MILFLVTILKMRFLFDVLNGIVVLSIKVVSFIYELINNQTLHIDAFLLFLYLNDQKS